MSDAAVSRTVFAGNTLTEDVTFRDEDGNNFVPTTVEYRLVLKSDRSEIADWTSAGTAAADMTITFPAFSMQGSGETEVQELTLFVDRQESGEKRSYVYDVTVINASS